MPLVVPVASVIVVWQIVFQNKGILNGLLHAIGLAEVSWLSEGWSFVILISLYIWKNCGYNIVLFLSGLSNIPKEYYESAYIDGAGNWACFRNITLPLLVPTLFFVFIMSLINSFKVFKEAFLLAGPYPPLDIYMLQHFMNNNFRSLNFQRLSTAAFLVLIIITLLVSAVYRVDKNYGQ